MTDHSQVQHAIAKLFRLIGGSGIKVFCSSFGTSYVGCTRHDIRWLFSVQSKGSISHYILTRSDLDNDGYLLVGAQLEDITKEPEVLAGDPSYVIQRNNGALQLQLIMDQMR